jgi:pyridoxamine 5'-phosphate oxidase
MTSDPIAKYHEWFAEANAKIGFDAKAACLATVGADGRPTTRMVLIQYVDEHGFAFFTNLGSPKAHDLAIHKAASLCLFWGSLERQVCIEGNALPVSDAEADAYFATRPRESQVGAWASKQSETLSSRDVLESRVKEFDAKFAGQPVPRPPNWSGFRLQPSSIEFWQGKPGRLHHRELFERSGSSWSMRLLFP